MTDSEERPPASGGDKGDEGDGREEDLHTALAELSKRIDEHLKRLTNS
ncbi:hypothetical protein [Streptomyces sp. MP131-18]|nr:hypothetical protein [Streptomyces sp. MP131-18]ONK12249.1 hypothetical protein STBA_29890 [Streptomyces sp. MP131-18]